MNKILVLYDSRTGNVAKMADLVAAGVCEVPDTEVRVRSVKEASAEDVYWCDGLAVGSPTNMGILSWKMKQFWDETMLTHWMKVDGKIACAFSSSGGWGGGMELACQSILTVLMNFGFLVFGVTDYAAKEMTLHYGAVAAKEPREDSTQASCRLLGRRLAEWTAVFVHGRTDQHPLNKETPRMPPS
ncbi:MAG: flavodoxin family protein [Pirellulaceae bacterium]|nr:flavodoxin family protein [Planctomycetaceae bacterium]HIM29120.1 flavodoxin family protein [Planctomycetota bacterium]